MPNARVVDAAAGASHQTPGASETGSHAATAIAYQLPLYTGNPRDDAGIDDLDLIELTHDGP